MSRQSDKQPEKVNYQLEEATSCFTTPATIKATNHLPHKHYISD